MAPARVCFSLDAARNRPFPPPRPLQRRQQRLDLAEFGRPLMAETIDRALQQPDPDFLGDGGKGLEIEDFGVRSPARDATSRSLKAR